MILIVRHSGHEKLRPKDGGMSSLITRDRGKQIQTEFLVKKGLGPVIAVHAFNA